MRNIRRGVKLRENGGRPRILDSISVSETHDFVELHHPQNRDTIRPIICEERDKSTKRKYLTVDDMPLDAIKKTGLRSIRRYQQILVPYAMNDTLMFM